MNEVHHTYSYMYMFKTQIDVCNQMPYTCFFIVVVFVCCCFFLFFFLLLVYLLYFTLSPAASTISEINLAERIFGRVASWEHRGQTFHSWWEANIRNIFLKIFCTGRCPDCVNHSLSTLSTCVRLCFLKFLIKMWKSSKIHTLRTLLSTCIKNADHKIYETENQIYTTAQYFCVAHNFENYSRVSKPKWIISWFPKLCSIMDAATYIYDMRVKKSQLSLGRSL